MTYLDYVFQTYNHFLTYLVAKNFKDFGVTEMTSMLMEERDISFLETLHIVEDLVRHDLFEQCVDFKTEKNQKPDEKIEELVASYRFNIKKGDLTEALGSVPFRDFCDDEKEFKIFKHLAVRFACLYPDVAMQGQSVEFMVTEGVLPEEDALNYLQKLKKFGCIKENGGGSEPLEFAFVKDVTNKYYLGLVSLASAIGIIREKLSSEMEYHWF
jgi:hypothetical protein